MSRSPAQVLELPLVEQVASLQAGEIKVVSLVEAAIERAERLQGAFNSFIRVDDRAALTRAKALDKVSLARRKTLRLFGAPVAHKDMFLRPDREVTFGSLLYANHRPTVTATVVQRIENAGGVDIGPLNMSEFASSAYGVNRLVGRARNPWNPDFVTGGSSSGSAAAVATRLVAASMGSDTGGSVRLPAAACGVFGLLPTNGRVSRYGMLPLSHSLDNAGPLGRSAKDLARVLGVVAGHDPLDPTSSPMPVDDYEDGLDLGLHGLKIGSPINYYPDQVDAATTAMLADATKTMGDNGGAIVSLEVPDPRPHDALGNVLILSEAASYHRETLRSRSEEYTPLVRDRIEFGFCFDAATYIDALRLRATELRHYVATVFSKVDVLILPTLPHAAPRWDIVESTVMGSNSAISGPWARFTRSINYLGLTAVTVPYRFNADGMPLAFQVVGRPFDEATILRVAHAFERIVPPRFPPS